MTETNPPTLDPHAAAVLAAQQSRGAGTLSLWTGLLGAPAAWLLKFQAMYILVPWACPVPHRMIYIHLLSVLVLALSAAAGYLSWREWTRTAPHSPVHPIDDDDDDDDDDATPTSRTRFLALMGIMNSSLFFLLSLGQGIATLMLNPCWD